MLKKFNEISTRFYLALQDEEGIGTIEVVLIVVVLVLLVIMFKDKIESIVKNALDKIGDKSQEIIK